MTLNNIILEAALLGLEEQKKRIDEQIEIVRSQLGRKGSGRPRMSVGTRTEVQTTGPKKRTISAAGRKRMADAQKRRWAAAKKSMQHSNRAVSKPVENKSATVKKMAATKKIAPPAKKNRAAAVKETAA